MPYVPSQMPAGIPPAPAAAPAPIRPIHLSYAQRDYAEGKAAQTDPAAANTVRYALILLALATPEGQSDPSDEDVAQHFGCSTIVVEHVRSRFHLNGAVFAINKQDYEQQVRQRGAPIC